MCENLNNQMNDLLHCITTIYGEYKLDLSFLYNAITNGHLLFFFLVQEKKKR